MEPIKASVIEDCQYVLDSVLDAKTLEGKIDEQSMIVESLSEAAKKLITDNSNTQQPQEEFKQKYEKTVSKFEKENGALSSLKKELDCLVKRKKLLENFVDNLRKVDSSIIDWNPLIFNLLIEKVVINEKKLTFQFYSKTKVIVII